jgi:hypothetical protein
MEGYNYFIANSQEDYVDGRYKNPNFAWCTRTKSAIVSQVLAGVR